MSEDAIRVLVVDDDFRVADVHAAMVGRVDGFEVVGTSHTAEDARLSIPRLRPDLVLMDIYLPDGSGLDVVRWLRERPEPPDAIVITAARDLDSVRTAVQLGALYYLIKPFGFRALADQLAAYRQLRAGLDALPPNADQRDVDALFGSIRRPQAVAVPPKGHSAPTLERVLRCVRGSGEDVSAAQVAEQIGMSRATAQRYLTLLEHQGLVRLDLRYGSAGRPEHRYRAV